VIAAKRAASMFAAAWAAAVWSVASHANGPEIAFDAGGIYPVRSANVQLESELVEVWLPGWNGEWEGRAECRYVLRNHDARPVAFDMAFVSQAQELGAPRYPMEFEVTQGERRLATRWVAVDTSRMERWNLGYWIPDSLPAWRVEIPGRGRAELTMRYTVYWNGGCDGADCGRSFGYVARPAALWRGRIASARIVFHVPSDLARQLAASPLAEPIRAVRATPAGFRWLPDGIEWRFEDWEPREDLHLGFDYVEAR
jgi:hypothetical protein